MNAKKQPTDKTVVVDFKVQVVDINVRLTRMAGAIAAYLPEGVNLAAGDFNVTDTQHCQMDHVSQVIVVQSFEAFLVTLTNPLGEIRDLQCKGVFIFYGELDHVEIKPIGVGNMTRISYLWA